MSHNYHRMCGCGACCEIEEAGERRDEYIDEFAPDIAEKLVGEEDFAWLAMQEVNPDAIPSVMRDVGVFFERFHNADNGPNELAAARTLYADLKPYVEAYADEQARKKVAAQYDKADS